MMLALKDYQQRTLDALQDYFVECDRSQNANVAFYTSTLKAYGTGITYQPIEELKGLPYVCLRVPTGGGKTLVACHTVELAAKNLLHIEHPLVLWLVPSNAIRNQTLEALKKRSHPYRQALEATQGSVTVLDVEEALYLNRSDLDTSTTIIVSTMQSFRVDDTLGRRVYRDSGQLMDHFSNIPPKTHDRLEKGEGGNLLHSLANVLCVRRPLVIVDEAHNVRTDLSFETLARFHPSCIIEFTATPAKEEHASNVLYSVSAAELKAEAMIKLPIRLETQPDWKNLMAGAIACRKGLEKSANEDRRVSGEYIRPIMLLQAQPHSKTQETLNVEVIRENLIKEFEIPEDQVAIVTGAQNELEKVEDISAEDCPIRFVITQQALREGWDCPFAYVLYSVAVMRSSNAVEQILGRILRLPNASWKEHEELNKAYAFVGSEHFYEAANTLTDALVQNGFEKQEAKDLIVQASTYQGEIKFEDDTLFMGTVFLASPEKPDLKKLPRSLKNKVGYDSKEKIISFKGVMVQEEVEDLKKCFKTDQGQEVVEKIYQISNGLPPEGEKSASEKGKPFKVPYLAIQLEIGFEQFEETHFLDFPWDLRKSDPTLTNEAYNPDQGGAQRGEITVSDEGKVEARFLDNLQREMAFLAGGTDWEVSDLVFWLDHNIPHPDLSQEEAGIFINQVVQELEKKRGLSLDLLVRDRYTLKNAVGVLMEKYRSEAHNQSYQAFLLPDCETPLVVNPEVCFSYDSRQYPYNTLYRGKFKFQKHYYPEVGDLKGEGEEFQCAQYLDQLEEVEFWVRNLERRPGHSFWLQTATDKFYPDFVCKLKDGRILVVEYKGEHLADTSDSKEKLALGELWEKRSEGKCLFLMPIGGNFEVIKQKINK